MGVIFNIQPVTPCHTSLFHLALDSGPSLCTMATPLRSGPHRLPPFPPFQSITFSFSPFTRAGTALVLARRCSSQIIATKPMTAETLLLAAAIRFMPPNLGDPRYCALPMRAVPGLRSKRLHKDIGNVNHPARVEHVTPCDFVQSAFAVKQPVERSFAAQFVCCHNLGISREADSNKATHTAMQKPHVF